MILIWLKFAICVVIIFFSGKRVAKYGDIIAEKTGPGGLYGAAINSRIKPYPIINCFYWNIFKYKIATA